MAADDEIPEGYYRASNGRIYPNKRQSLLDRFTEDPEQAQKYLANSYGVSSVTTATSERDPDFPEGYEILDPAPTRNIADVHGNTRNRAQKAAYNPVLMVLVIKMRDNSLIVYRGVMPDKWDTFKKAESTNDFIEYELHGYPWSKAASKGALPQSPRQSFESGTND